MGALDAVYANGISSATGTLTPSSPAAGDSLTVRSFPPPARAHLLSVAGSVSSINTTTNLIAELKSPRLHDAVHGIHMEQVNQPVLVGSLDPNMLPWSPSSNTLESQDTLEYDLAGDGTNTDRSVLVIFYENLPGVNARLITTKALRQRAVSGQIVGIQVQATDTAAATDWEGGVPITDQYDTLKANRDYALLGGVIVPNSAGTPVGGGQLLGASLRSSDTGNLRVFMPGGILPSLSKDWFVRQSAQYETYGADPKDDVGLISVFNASNKGSMITDIIGLDYAIAFDIVWYFQLLD